MKQKPVTIISILLFCAIFACNSEQKNRDIKISDNLSTSYEEVDGIKDVSMHGGTIKRIVVHIIIPLGRTEEEIRATLKKAAIEIGTREKAKATTVNGYRPQDDRSGVWTAGRAIFAPNGKWENAGDNAPMAVTVEVDMNSLYFQKEHQEFYKDQEFILVSRDSAPVEISKYRDRWEDNDIVAKIPVGTPIQLIEAYKVPMTPDKLFVRYHISVVWKGKTLDGWVHEEEIAKKKR